MDATRPYQALGSWLKEKAATDVTHCILRYDGLLLVTYCGRLIQIKEAVKPIGGARHCEVCESRRRKHLKERSGHGNARR
jgi:hypothetical protein